jgi:hypothetical protein
LAKHVPQSRGVQSRRQRGCARRLFDARKPALVDETMRYVGEKARGSARLTGWRYSRLKVKVPPDDRAGFNIEE